MAQPEHMTMNRTKKFQAGFSLLETMVAMAVLLGVGAIVMYGTIRMMNTQGTITNRTEMHSSVRSATELLQQEIGQAGRIAPPLNVAGTAPEIMTLLTAVVVATDTPVVAAVTISPATAVPSLFNGEWITVDAGMDATGAPRQESVAITCGNPCSNPVTATFGISHAIGAPRCTGERTGGFRVRSCAAVGCERLERDGAKAVRRRKWRRQYGLRGVQLPARLVNRARISLPEPDCLERIGKACHG